jgi:hypothetical protein
MEKVIAIPDELYDRLQAQAQAQGLSVEGYLEQLQNEAERAREATFRDRLRARGLLVTWPEPVQPPSEFNPIEVKG